MTGDFNLEDSNPTIKKIQKQLTDVQFNIDKSNKYYGTFNVSFDDKSLDESRFARKIAKKLGTTHTQINFDKEGILIDQINIMEHLLDLNIPKLLKKESIIFL